MIDSVRFDKGAGQTLKLRLSLSLSLSPSLPSYLDKLSFNFIAKVLNLHARDKAWGGEGLSPLHVFVKRNMFELVKCPSRSCESVSNLDILIACLKIPSIPVNTLLVPFKGTTEKERERERRN